MFTLLLCSLTPVISHDHIIFRSGQECDVKLFQVNNEKIVFSYLGNEHERHAVSLKEVYMIYIEKQGNVYISPDGQRLSGEKVRVNPKKYNVIYLIKGSEIPANEIKINEDVISYTYTDKGSVIGKANFWGRKTVESTLNKADVFFIRYKSGMVDIINPLDSRREPQANDQTQKVEYSIVYHKVAKGETIEMIASKYDVTIQNVIDRNELPATTTPTTRLKAGKELMIYKPKTR